MKCTEKFPAFRVLSNGVPARYSYSYGIGLTAAIAIILRDIISTDIDGTCFNKIFGRDLMKIKVFTVKDICCFPKEHSQDCLRRVNWVPVCICSWKQSCLGCLITLQSCNMLQCLNVRMQIIWLITIMKVWRVSFSNSHGPRCQFCAIQGNTVWPHRRMFVKCREKQCDLTWGRFGECRGKQCDTTHYRILEKHSSKLYVYILYIYGSCRHYTLQNFGKACLQTVRIHSVHLWFL